MPVRLVFERLRGEESDEQVVTDLPRIAASRSAFERAARRYGAAAGRKAAQLAEEQVPQIVQNLFDGLG